MTWWLVVIWWRTRDEGMEGGRRRRRFGGRLDLDGRVLYVIMYLGIAYQSNDELPVSVCPFVVQGKMRG